MGTGNNGIKITDSDDAVISFNTVDDVVDDGVDVDSSDNVLIEENEIGLLGGAWNIGDDGIDLDDSDGAMVSANKIKNAYENGIDARDFYDIDIDGNIIRKV